MTWYYDIADDGSSIDIYDESGALYNTVTNDGSGFQPREVVLQQMENKAIDEYQANGFNSTVFTILRDAVFENFQEGTPV